MLDDRSTTREGFTIECRRCERLANYRDEVHGRYPDYYSAAVPSFGDPEGRLLIVGLAPGLHGANATGRPFTGDYAGILLYKTLFDFGFATRPVSESASDGLELMGCRLTNAVRCLPPENKPTTREVDTCNPFLADELDKLPQPGVVLALGTIAHRAVLKALGLKFADFPFAHSRKHAVGRDLVMFDSYHCSRYNTQTRRLTETMFRGVFAAVKKSLDG